MERIAPDEARAALEAVDHADRHVADEVGLPRWYWWVLALGWVALGVIGEFTAQWITLAATLLFGMVHSAIASRLLGGQRRTGGVQVSKAVAGVRTPVIVIAMLLVLVAITVGASLALQADGAGHARIWAAVFVAALVGLGGPETLRVLRGWVRA